MNITNELTKNFIESKIAELTEGKAPEAAIEALNNFLIGEQPEEIKKGLIGRVNQKQIELVKALAEESKAIKAEKIAMDAKIAKYNEDIKKVEEFKKSLRN